MSRHQFIGTICLPLHLLDNKYWYILLIQGLLYARCCGDPSDNKRTQLLFDKPIVRVRALQTLSNRDPLFLTCSIIYIVNYFYELKSITSSSIAIDDTAILDTCAYHAEFLLEEKGQSSKVQKECSLPDQYCERSNTHSPTMGGRLDAQRCSTGRSAGIVKRMHSGIEI